MGDQMKRIALLVLILFGCSVPVPRRKAEARDFANALYPGWSIIGIAANESVTVFGRRVSVSLRDPETRETVRLVLSCSEDGICIEAGDGPGCSG